MRLDTSPCGDDEDSLALVGCVKFCVRTIGWRGGPSAPMASTRPSEVSAMARGAILLSPNLLIPRKIPLRDTMKSGGSEVLLPVCYRLIPRARPPLTSSGPLGSARDRGSSGGLIEIARLIQHLLP